MIVLTAALAASLTQADVVAQSPAPTAPPVATAPIAPAPLPVDDTVAATDKTAADKPAPDQPAPDTAVSDKVTGDKVGGDKAGSGDDIVVSGAKGMKKIDPVEGVNKVTFAAMEGVDKALVGPITHIYRDDVPRPIRLGLHNFFFNLTEPLNALNYMLQLHPGKAFQTLERFGINSTVGIGGLIDVAKKKPFNLHYRPNGFGNTFGYWGIPPGPFLFLPLVGPTSVRDVIGSFLDQFPAPLLFKPLKNYYFVVGSGVITELDYRVDIDAGVERVRKTKDVYASYRKAYFQSRFDEIEALHGRGPLAKGEEGQPPFVRPLGTGFDGVPSAGGHDVMPATGMTPATSLTPASNLTPPTDQPATAQPAPATAAPIATAPQAPVFVAQPVVQPHPTVQPLPPEYKPGGS